MMGAKQQYKETEAAITQKKKNQKEADRPIEARKSPGVEHAASVPARVVRLASEMCYFSCIIRNTFPTVQKICLFQLD